MNKEEYCLVCLNTTIELEEENENQAKKIEVLEKENGELKKTEQVRAYSYHQITLDRDNLLEENKNLIAALKKACELFSDEDDGSIWLDDCFHNSPEYQAIKHLLEDEE